MDSNEHDNDSSDDQTDLKNSKKYDCESSPDKKITKPIQYTRPDSEKPKTLTSTKWYIYLAVGISVFAAIVYVGDSHMCVKSVGDMVPSKDLKKYIKVWKNNFPKQNLDTWYSIAGQLEEFIAGGHPAPIVFVLAYSEAVRTTELLAIDLARAALELKYANDKCGDSNQVKLRGNDGKIKKGYMLGEHLSYIKDCKKMILFNLEELDTVAAQDLHSLLDPDYPNIRNAVYVFTVKVSNDGDKNVYHQVIDTLTNRWGPTLEDDKLNPLFSRLVNNIKILPEAVYDS